MSWIKCIIYFGVFNIAIGQYQSDIIELKDSHNRRNTQYQIKNGTIHMTLKQYICAWHNLTHTKPLTFGSKSWVFPKQDVNLVLTYPSKDEIIKTDDIITKFNVFLKIDGNESRAFITSGGILKDNISLSFVFRGITSLSYQFWLYGMPSSYLNRVDPYFQVHSLC